MLQHNLLLIVRSFKRFKSTFIINLIGLSTGLASALLIYLWVTDELSFDKFHEKDSRLFQVIERIQMADQIGIAPHTAGLLGEAIEEKIPEVEYAISSRLLRENKILSVGDKNIEAIGLYASQNFFNVFSYDIIQGDKDQVLTDKSAIVISEELAMNLFNTSENVIGKVVEFQHDKQYQVSGVFKGTPPNSSIQFDFVLSFEEYKEVNSTVLNWTYNSSAVYVALNEGANIEEFNDKIADFVKSRTGDSLRTLSTRPYSDAYLYGNYENGVQTGGRIEYVRLFSIIAIFMLLIACINFMNLSTAKASRRLKEVGIKKTLGADQKALMFQYLGESMLMTFLSLAIAILLVVLFLPQFNQITGKQLALSFDINLILSVLGITLFTGLIAGSYPALYLSGFNPITVLKGKLNTSVGELWARKGLVVFQFALSIILIVGVLVVYKQIEFVQTKNLGYDKDNVIYFKIEGKVKENLETFLSEVRNIPGIVNASSIGPNIVGGINTITTDYLHWEGKKIDGKTVFEIRTVNYGMIEMLGIEMTMGRTFSRDFSTEESKVILNEAAIEAMGLEDPIGKVVTIRDNNFEIIGVTKNFHLQSLHKEVNPLYFVIGPQWTDNILAKIEAGRERETIEQLQQFYQEYNPGFPFAYQFLDEAYQAQYVAEQRVSILSRYFAGIAIIISCLGLFGLAAFTAQKRQKEIGIRKVVGASVSNIAAMLSKDFLKLILIAVLIAFPLSWWAMNEWLNDFAYRINIGAGVFLIAGASIIFITLLTISFQAIKAAIANPVTSLRTE